MNLIEIPWYNLIVKEYVIKKDTIYKGKFVKYTPHTIVSGWHELTIGWHMNFCVNGKPIIFDDKCLYYDPKDYYQYQAKVAQQTMESRSLSKILKRVVNEEFEW
jgi:hypothetical protein